MFTSGTMQSLKRELELAPTQPAAGDTQNVESALPKAALSYVPLKTGLVYDVRMRYHAKLFTSYFEYIDPHPEDPRRIYRIYKILAENGLITDPQLQGLDELGPYMLKLPIREATKEEILRVHSQEHLDFIESTQKMTKEELLKETEKGDSVYFNNDSLLSAKLSCGGAIEACKAVVEGKVKNALAIVRPPGHHAEPDSPGGFCLFSNVAVAAKAVLEQYPESVRRVIVLDWDIHHGNGTQKAFYDDPRVLYISLHRYESGKFYPGTTEGGADKVGSGKGKGFNVNIPWPVGGMGDADYLYAFRQVVVPICQEFNPDLVIISSGFDAAHGDVIGGCHVSPAGYGHMAHMLKALAKGNLCVVLEGGYNLDSIAKSALAVSKVLLGEPPELLKHILPKSETISVVADVLKIQSKFWKSLKPSYYGLDYAIPSNLANPAGRGDASPNADAVDVEDSFGLNQKDMSTYKLLEEDVRGFQRIQLFDQYGFIKLPMEVPNADSTGTTSLKSSILASTDLFHNDKLVIIVHPPTRLWARHDPITGILDPSSAVEVDQSRKFIDWALKEKYSIVDVNVPTSSHEDLDFNSITWAQDALIYLWDNYLQYLPGHNGSIKMAFIGVGEAYNGIVHLFGHRDVRSKVFANVNFLDQNVALRAIVPSMDETILDWFFRHSLVFASAKHACWGGASAPSGAGDNEGNGEREKGPGGGERKRPRKKYGRVLKADVSIGGVDAIIDERFEETCDFVQDAIDEFESESESD